MLQNRGKQNKLECPKLLYKAAIMESFFYVIVFLKQTIFKPTFTGIFFLFSKKGTIPYDYYNNSYMIVQY